MLLGSSTKYGAGFRLAGDHTDLCDLYETIHYFVPENGLVPLRHDEVVLGLAYDVRHAYQGDRDTQLINNPNGSSIYFAVDIFWPIFFGSSSYASSDSSIFTNNEVSSSNPVQN